MSQAGLQADFTLQTLDSVELRLPVAGIGARSYAFIADWHVRVLAALLWALGAMLLGSRAGGHHKTYTLYAVILPALLIYIGYHPVVEVLTGGRTPGKRLAGLRIVTLEGQVPGTGALIVRNLFRLIDSLPACYVVGLAVATFSQRVMRIGDMAAGTMVIYDEADNASALDTDALLGARSIDPKLLLLVEDILRRWKELDPVRRDPMARELLQRAGRKPSWDSEALREALERLRESDA